MLFRLTLNINSKNRKIIIKYLASFCVSLTSLVNTVQFLGVIFLSRNKAWCVEIWPLRARTVFTMVRDKQNKQMSTPAGAWFDSLKSRTFKAWMYHKPIPMGPLFCSFKNSFGISEAPSQRLLTPWLILKSQKQVSQSCQWANSFTFRLNDEHFS